MTVLRHLHIQRFRGIAEAEWVPHEGVNGLIGAGDSGKSTLLDAIDLVLAPRRNLTFTDADFLNLDVSAPIQISATLGALSDSLQDLDLYGSFLRGWNSATKTIVDEPAEGHEVVLTLRLTVDSDLEPHWALYSERGEVEGYGRDLPFAERGRLAPMRLGAYAAHHFSWGARSVLNRVSEERASANQALAEAAREARKTFGDRASSQVSETLKIVKTVASAAGVRGAADVQALLDAHGVTFNGGAIALHDGAGIPMRNLGIGSSRLLVANLQAVAAEKSSISLIDELEHGLEPYRIARLLHTLGSKSQKPKGQVFLTTHSPICVRELAARQLWRVNRRADALRKGKHNGWLALSYVPGNHDFMVQLSPRLRAIVCRFLSLDHDAAKPFPLCHIDHEASVYATHGHASDPLNWHRDVDGYWAIGDAIVLRVVNRFAEDACQALGLTPTTQLGQLVVGGFRLAGGPYRSAHRPSRRSAQIIDRADLHIGSRLEAGGDFLGRHQAAIPSALMYRSRIASCSCRSAWSCFRSRRMERIDTWSSGLIARGSGALSHAG